jgi:hypothetical protein
MTKLKTNKILTKEPRVKIKNQKNKARIGKKLYMINYNLKTKLKS